MNSLLRSILGITLIFGYQAHAQFDQLDKNDFGLDGDVRKLVEKQAGLEDEPVTRPYEEYYFDQKGHIEKVHFFENDSLVGIGHYSFSDNGKLLSIKAQNPDGSEVGSFVDNTIEEGLITIKSQPMTGRKSIFTYDDNGNKVKEVEYYGDKRRVGYSFDYDSEGNMVRKVRLLPDGTEDYVFQYEYDEDGNQIKQDGYFQGKFNDGWVFVYDKDGNRIEEHHKGGDGKVYASFIYEYDNNGNQLSKVEKDGTGKVKNREVSEYNGNGDLIKEEKYGFNGQLVISTTLKYEYDKRGNWIKKQVIQNDELANIIVREIAYH